MRSRIETKHAAGRAFLAAVLLALAGAAGAQRLSLEGLQAQINAKISLSDLAGCAANDSVVRVGGIWKCKSTLARFVDNGNGTVTDNKTGLVWEKKTGVPPLYSYDHIVNPSCAFGAPCDLHEVSHVFSFHVPLKEFLDQFNDLRSPNDGTTTGCFAGYCDWRLPTIAELRSILTAPSPLCTSPCIDPVFGPTANAINPLNPQVATNVFYWTSNDHFPGTNPQLWTVEFRTGAVVPQFYNTGFAAGAFRAVRGAGSDRQ